MFKRKWLSNLQKTMTENRPQSEERHCFRPTRSISWWFYDKSLDLNSMENLQVDFKHGFVEAKPRNVGELLNVVQSSWVGKPVHRSQKLLDTQM